MDIVTYALCNSKISSATTGISNITIDSNKHLVFKMSDGSNMDAGKIPNGMSFSIVSSLPTSNIDDSTLYFVLSTDGDGNNIYTEYVYINGAWECLGSKDTVKDSVSDSVGKEEDIDNWFK